MCLTVRRTATITPRSVCSDQSVIVAAIGSSRRRLFIHCSVSFSHLSLSLLSPFSLLHVPPCKHRPPPVEVGKVQIAFALGFELWR